MNLDQRASKHFSFRDFIECGPTWREAAVGGQPIDNRPSQQETWTGLRELAATVLDPIWDKFGPITLTYGLSSPALARAISTKPNSGIAPSVDQHSGSELNTRGKHICSRKGVACDFYVDGLKTRMNEVALWTAKNLKFDRLYYYGREKSLHISVGPEMKQAVVLMSTEATGRRRPGKHGVNENGSRLLSAVAY